MRRTSVWLWYSVTVGLIVHLILIVVAVMDNDAQRIWAITGDGSMLAGGALLLAATIGTLQRHSNAALRERWTAIALVLSFLFLSLAIAAQLRVDYTAPFVVDVSDAYQIPIPRSQQEVGKLYVDATIFQLNRATMFEDADKRFDKLKQKESQERWVTIIAMFAWVSASWVGRMAHNERA